MPSLSFSHTLQGEGGEGRREEGGERRVEGEGRKEGEGRRGEGGRREKGEGGGREEGGGAVYRKWEGKKIVLCIVKTWEKRHEVNIHK